MIWQQFLGRVFPMVFLVVKVLMMSLLPHYSMGERLLHSLLFLFLHRVRADQSHEL